jgi:hypothetical protein
VRWAIIVRPGAKGSQHWKSILASWRKNLPQSLQPRAPYNILKLKNNVGHSSRMVIVRCPYDYRKAIAWGPHKFASSWGERTTILRLSHHFRLTSCGNRIGIILHKIKGCPYNYVRCHTDTAWLPQGFFLLEKLEKLYGACRIITLHQNLQCPLRCFTDA